MACKSGLQISLTVSLQLAARSELEQVGMLPNWSPVVDLTTTYEPSAWQMEPTDKEKATRQAAVGNTIRRPDRIFTASGRGMKGSVTELRWGIQARIGLEMDLDEPIRNSWMFPIEISGQLGFYTLLSMPHSSAVLHISGDLTQADALTSESVAFDTTSRTLCAIKNQAGLIVQVTENSTTIVTPLQRYVSHFPPLVDHYLLMVRTLAHHLSALDIFMNMSVARVMYLRKMLHAWMMS